MTPEDFEDLLIANENQNAATCLIFDDHRYHINRHLSYIWKPRIFLHILQHIRLMVAAKKRGIPTIKLDEVLRCLKK